MLLPSIVESQVRQGIADYLHTTFPITTPLFSNLLNGLIDGAGEIFKGPYISLGLPFRKGSATADYFLKAPLPFPPYLHQELAFGRLAGESPKSTIVATGTGSGKTESFLWPILAYCLDRAPSQGIKAILIYPMNALALDQAKRIAKTIYANPNLKGRVTAGLYVGGEEDTPHTSMGAENVITDKETMRESPPDILLTNYKMLDYLLQRPRDKSLWSTTSAETLKYLVVDELHTFDGAQGTDLACLIRRLKYRVGLTQGQLCCVGTSATLGTAESDQTILLDYVQRIFGEPFDKDSIITEIRQETREFLAGSFIRYEQLPELMQADKLIGNESLEIGAYLAEQLSIWFNKEIVPEPIDDPAWRVALGKRLKELPLFRSVLEILNGRIRSIEEIHDELGTIYREFSEEQAGTPQTRQRYCLGMLSSLFSMVSAARAEGIAESFPPFLQVRIQSWTRELRRMVADVSSQPTLRFAADLTADQHENHLPVVHCRECGAVGWTGIRRSNAPNTIRANLKDFYSKFFADRVSSDVAFMFPGDDEDFEESKEKGKFYYICSNCLELNSSKGQCSECGSDTIRVFVPNNKRSITRNNAPFIISTKDCPACQTRSSLMLIGAQSASLCSVAINQLFASKFNGDKKLLAFSDNVQDASHRVGFFSARTWRFNLRAAIRQYLDLHTSETPLDSFLTGFISHWRKEFGDANFVAAFTPRDMMWMEEFEKLAEHDDESQLAGFIEILSRRIAWEIFAEFGFDCRRGRTLEKSGAAILIPVIDLAAASETLTARLENQHERLRGNITTNIIEHFLLGIVEHARQNGAIFRPEMDAYIVRGGDPYLLSRMFWMPKYGPGMKVPGYFAEQKKLPQRSQFESWCDTGDWIYQWTIKCFEQYDPLVENSVIDILPAAFEVLKASGLFTFQDIADNRIWGMVSSKFMVAPDVVQLRCARCGHQISIGKAHGAIAPGLLCFKSGCRGVYKTANARRDYYDALYRHGDIVRLFAEEHTSLLTREKRQLIEQKFKLPENKRKNWYPNLLSCTPTLELGIDIGDLSSVLMCSVPPAQASYLQRIGRAGRTDGNAVSMIVAQGKPHDLYFFEDPMEMMAGTVAIPGVHLAAMAVLERQLTAFCLDCWVHENASIDIPPKMIDVFSRVEKNRTDLFPLCFYEYVQKNRKRLFVDFCGLFNEYLVEDARTYLSQYLEGGQEAPLVVRIYNEIRDLRDSRDALKKKQETVRRKLDKIKNDQAASQEEKDSLYRENLALGGLVRSINEKETLNFFTDAGVIPNYAFPESGVILHSVIYRKKQRGGTGEWETKEYEYQRSARSAIQELVPGNVFYANGRHVTIDQIDVTLSQPEEWRFCPICNHMEHVVSTEPTRECPHCGSQGWFDGSQVRTLLRVRQVFANTSDKDSLTRDDKDEREPRFYIRHLCVGFNPDDIEGAWSVENEDLTFGFEFIRKTTFREINFGEKSTENTENIMVAGKEYPATGFVICRHCGTIQKRKSDKPNHANFCSARDKESTANFEHVCYLYREFQSESIRFLVPAVTEGAERKIQSFLAALMMGLREQYRGDIDHLTTCVYDEPVPHFPQQRKRYVVLYDTVPGGTGYLKQITKDKELIFGVLEKALKRMQACSCRHDKERDGCYHCLLVYRNSRMMDSISRETAEELLASILSNRDNIKKVHSLSGITMNRILESELEKKFIAALSERLKKEGGFFSMEMRENKPCYRMEFTGVGKKWIVEPQREIKTADTNEILCRADFVLHPDNFEGQKIAVFTDGFAFHKDRIGIDMRQRMALLHHPEKYLTWSLTWNDIERFESGSAYDPDMNILHMSILQQGHYNGFCAKMNTDTSIAPSDKSAMNWLLDYLKHPDPAAWMRNAIARTLSVMDPTDREEPARSEKLLKVKTLLTSALASELKIEVGTVPVLGELPFLNRGHLVQSHHITDGPLKWPQSLQTVYLLDDRTSEDASFERSWNEFLRMVNLFQFVPWSAFLTKADLEAGTYDEFYIGADDGSKKQRKEHSQGWAEAFTLAADASVRALLEKLFSANVSVPVVGYELIDETKRICGMAELAWEDNRIAYLMSPDGMDSFKASGWHVFLPGEEQSLIEAVKE